MTNTEIIKINKNVKSIQDEAGSIMIKNEQDVQNAVAFLQKIRSWKKRINDIRLSYTKPLNESLKRINTDFKNSEKPLDILDKDVSQKMCDYREKEAEKIRKQQKKEAEKQRKAFEKEQERKRKALEKQQDELTKKEAKEAEKEIEQEEFTPTPTIKQETTVRSGDAKMVARKVWTFETEDETKIPREFLKVDEVLIRNAIRSGAREIKGIRIYQKENFSIG